MKNACFHSLYCCRKRTLFSCKETTWEMSLSPLYYILTSFYITNKVRLWLISWSFRHFFSCFRKFGRSLFISGGSIGCILDKIDPSVELLLSRTLVLRFSHINHTYIYIYTIHFQDMRLNYGLSPWRTLFC